MTIEAIDPHRIVWRDGVDPVVPRQFAAPLLMIPVAFGDPRSSRQRRSILLDSAYEFGWRLGVAELNGGEPVSATEKVDVRVDEAGRDHHPSCIDDACPGPDELSDLRARSYRRDALTVDGDGVGPRTSRVAGPHSGVHDGERRRGERRCGCSRTMSDHGD